VCICLICVRASGMHVLRQELSLACIVDTNCYASDTIFCTFHTCVLQNPFPTPKIKQRLPGVGPRESLSPGSAGGAWVASGAGLTEEQMRQTMSTAQSSLSESSPKFKDLRLPPRPMLAPLAGGAARRQPPKKLQNLADGAEASTHKSMPVDPGTPGRTARGRAALLYDEDEVVNL